MAVYKCNIHVFNWLDMLLVAPLLLYRRLRYGYTFRRIPLANSKKYAIVDPQDYYWLSQYTWLAEQTHYSYRAVRLLCRGRTSALVNMHRLIMNAPKHLFVDHINRNSLDNRRANLRLATHAQNCQNRTPSTRTGKTSKYKGVYWLRDRNKWRSCIRANNKYILLGQFNSEVEAAKAYDAAARKYHGSFASPNFQI